MTTNTYTQPTHTHKGTLTNTTEPRTSLFRQPTAVWAIAFACAISFMGIGLVDPILPKISEALNASQSETMLLFTSYLFVTGIAMFFTSWVSGRIGVKWALIAGLTLIVVFAGLAGLAGSVDAIIGFRAGWGLGNALFLSTALAAIVGAASGGSRQAIVLYEAALGVGMAVGPLVGGALGEISWRGPFFGTAILMAIALIAILVLLRFPKQSAAERSAARAAAPSVTASFRALGNPALLSLSLVAVCYNFGFFTLLAYSPYPVEAAAQAAGLDFGAHELGLVFFGWGLALAVTSVVVAPMLTRRLGLRPVLFVALSLFAVCLVLLGVCVASLAALVSLVIVSGLLLGVMNTALTEAVMEATDLPRSVASSTYSSVRFIGGAVAPAIAGPVAAALGAPAPYWIGAAAVVMAILVLALMGKHLAHIGEERDGGSVPSEIAEAQAVGVGDAS
ncbi:MFS transporter [Leucobacter sp. NPDC015123]|uniref:MFS transporter n=1 Tax=Leucobacter sp. NPDC015123 TaxID=3364129 RepID=UPI0036F46857